MIIHLQEADIIKILPLIERLHDKTIHSHVEFSAAAAVRNLMFGIVNPLAAVLVDDQFQGILALNIVAHPCNDEYLQAKEVVFGGERLGVGFELVEAGAEWAKSMGCQEMIMALEPHICGRSAFRLYKRWGLTPVIAGFVRRFV